MSATRQIFSEDAYATTSDCTVVAINELGGIILDQTPFYATSGGQPGDTGFLEREDGSQITIATTVYEKGSRDIIVHVSGDGEPDPAVGEKLVAHIDWNRRYRLMRMHTACHILSVVCPLSDYRSSGKRR